jgi:hypothetical protein
MHASPSSQGVHMRQLKHDSLTRAMKLCLTAIVGSSLGGTSLHLNHVDSYNQNKLQCMVRQQPNTGAWLAGGSNLTSMLVRVAWVDPVSSRPVPRKVGRYEIQLNRTALNRCPNDGTWVRSVGQVGNFKRKYLANQSDSAAHLWSGKWAYTY